MDDERLDRLLTALHTTEGDGSVLRRICVTCKPCIPVDGAGLSGVEGGRARTLVASDNESAAIELLQIELGEGPSTEALATSRRSQHRDLKSSEARRRWPRFASAATEHGVTAVLALPLITRGEPVGVLGLHRRQPGDLEDGQMADAVLLAELATLALDRGDGSMTVDATGITVEPVAPWAHSAVVHNACGMIAAQLDISVDDALLRLRTLAFVRTARSTSSHDAVVAPELALEAWLADD